MGVHLVSIHSQDEQDFVAGNQNYYNHIQFENNGKYIENKKQNKTKQNKKQNKQNKTKQNKTQKKNQKQNKTKTKTKQKTKQKKKKNNKNKQTKRVGGIVYSLLMATSKSDAYDGSSIMIALHPPCSSSSLEDVVQYPQTKEWCGLSWVVLWMSSHNVVVKAVLWRLPLTHSWHSDRQTPTS